MTVTVRKKPIIGVLQIIAVAILIALAFMYSREPDKTDSSGPPAQNFSVDTTQSAPLVSIVKPRVTSEQLTVTSTGSVAVRSYITLASQVSGRVIETSDALRNGGSFSAGETLVTLEQRDFTLAVAQVEADVTAAKATLQLSEAEASVDIRSYQRLHPGKDVPPLIAKEPQITQAKAQLQAAVVRRDIALVNLERSIFSLPFAGKVVESSAGEGQILNAGQSFGRVYALDALEVVISLSPQELAQISPIENRVVKITADGEIFEGKVDRIAAERNARTQFSQVFLTVKDNPSLIPGTFVSVTLTGPLINNTLRLPESALQVGQTFWVVEDDAIKSVKASILGRSNGSYLVESFDYADGIVTGTIPGARAGMAVRIAEAK